MQRAEVLPLGLLIDAAQCDGTRKMAPAGWPLPDRVCQESNVICRGTSFRSQLAPDLFVLNVLKPIHHHVHVSLPCDSPYRGCGVADQRALDNAC